MYIFCFILLFTSSPPCRKDQFAILYFSTEWSWESNQQESLMIFKKNLLKLLCLLLQPKGRTHASYTWTHFKKALVHCNCMKEDRWPVNAESTALLRSGTLTLNENRWGSLFVMEILHKLNMLRTIHFELKPIENSSFPRQFGKIALPQQAEGRPQDFFWDWQDVKFSWVFLCRRA